MGALYHLKQKLVDFCNVIQENVSRTDTVPSSKVVYDLKADSDSRFTNLQTSLADLHAVNKISGSSKNFVITLPSAPNAQNKILYFGRVGYNSNDHADVGIITFSGATEAFAKSLTGKSVSASINGTALTFTGVETYGNLTFMSTWEIS